jgi:predicted nucleic acid-binding protein
MKLVVDANTVISALISEGKVLKVFKANSALHKYELFAPDLLISETLKHRGDIILQAGISEELFDKTLKYLLSEINIVPKEEFDEQINKALDILSTHTKDVPYLALSLKLDCKILSGDKTLRRLCPDKTLTPGEALKEILPKEES